jgi:tRNA dimethylallyltransferase
MTTTPRPTIFVLGPTAGGKTELSIELAHRLPGGGECCCADSMQVYRGMDIGTAKPTDREQAAAPHHLLDLVDPGDSFSVDDWLGHARPCVSNIKAGNKWPILVGGTNLYIQAFLGGFMEGPEPDESLRAQLAEDDPGEHRRELERVDPVAAERIHPNDRRRTVRAIEVFRLTGRAISEMQVQWARADANADVLIIGLNWPVDVINGRINARVGRMMESGFLDEVQRLHDAGSFGGQSREALGYKQLLEHLEGGCSHEEAVEQIKILSRRFAKQQRTWLRRFQYLWEGHWIEAAEKDTETIANKALAFINSSHAAPPS